MNRRPSFYPQELKVAPIVPFIEAYSTYNGFTGINEWKPHSGSCVFDGGFVTSCVVGRVPDDGDQTDEGRCSALALDVACMKRVCMRGDRLRP